MKKTLGLALVLALCGCGANTNHSQFAQEIDQQVDQISALRVQYQQQITNPSFDVIRERISLSGSYPKLGTPCTGAATDTYPTEAEKAAIRRWADARSAFIAQLAVLAKPTPNASERVARFMEQLDKANFEAAAEISVKLDALSQGNLTYCQFAQTANAVNRQAHKQTGGYRNTIDEEILLNYKLRMGFPAASLVY